MTHPPPPFWLWSARATAPKSRGCLWHVCAMFMKCHREVITGVLLWNARTDKCFPHHAGCVQSDSPAADSVRRRIPLMWCQLCWHKHLFRLLCKRQSSWEQDWKHCFDSSSCPANILVTEAEQLESNSESLHFKTCDRWRRHRRRASTVTVSIQSQAI